MHAWGNGAPGIGLSRADLLRRGTSSGATLLRITEDLDLAVDSVLVTGPLANHSLCHGELGTLELLTAAAALGNAEAAAHRARRADRVVAAVERGDARCGTPGAVGTPGLLTGYAGIGHGLLRLAHPERIPTVLLLEPPAVTR
jgi:lantibiotic modifying enzyme